MTAVLSFRYSVVMTSMIALAILRLNWRNHKILAVAFHRAMQVFAFMFGNGAVTERKILQHSLDEQDTLFRNKTSKVAWFFRRICLVFPFGGRRMNNVELEIKTGYLVFHPIPEGVPANTGHLRGGGDMIVALPLMDYERFDCHAGTMADHAGRVKEKQALPMNRVMTRINQGTSGAFSERRLQLMKPEQFLDEKQQNNTAEKPGTGDAAQASGDNEEIFHLQADGFWGPEKGFQDAEELRRQRRN